MRLSVITDEISQDMEHALAVCREMGVRTVELRAVNGASILAHDNENLRRIRAMLDDGGFAVCAIASPFLKCHLRGDGQAQGNTHFAAPATREEQWGVLERSFEVADLFGAPVVRSFSFWRVDDPESVREDVLEVLREATRRTEVAGLTLALENEHACNIATGAEAAWYLERIDSPSFGLIWDPGNEAALGSRPFPEGYERVRGRIVHVHLKDLDTDSSWTKIGTGAIDYEGQLQALAEDSYRGALSIETHYSTPTGEAATRECIEGVRQVAARAGVALE